MKSKLVLMCIMAVISLGLLACSESAPPASAECAYAWNQETEVAFPQTDGG